MFILLKVLSSWKKKDQKKNLYQYIFFLVQYLALKPGPGDQAASPDSLPNIFNVS